MRTWGGWLKTSNLNRIKKGKSIPPFMHSSLRVKAIKLNYSRADIAKSSLHKELMNDSDCVKKKKSQTKMWAKKRSKFQKVYFKIALLVISSSTKDGTQSAWLIHSDHLVAGHGGLQPVVEDADLRWRTHGDQSFLADSETITITYRQNQVGRIPWRRHRGGPSRHSRSPRTRRPAAHHCTPRGHQSHPDTTKFMFNTGLGGMWRMLKIEIPEPYSARRGRGSESIQNGCLYSNDL